jgi:hypothetical protein
MKILCFINHFFGANPHFLGKSSLPAGTDPRELQRRAETRKKLVEQVIDQLKKIGDIDIRVCGIEGYGLVPLDITFDHIRDKPLWMVYETLNHMGKFVDDYDYFINIEDDIFLPKETFDNIVRFDQVSMINEILFPNRMERRENGELYCVDFIPLPGWTQQRKRFEGKDYQVGMNAHSALLILSREKLKYALKHIDPNFRGKLLYNELDSAFAYFHSSFALFRSVDINHHQVIHLDKWYYSPGEEMSESVWAWRLKSIRSTDFIPPVLVRLAGFFRKKNWEFRKKGKP